MPADTKALRVAAADLNGVPRGKRLPVSAADKLLKDGTRFPFSALNVDLWGEDIEDSPLVLASGDQDGFLYATERGYLPVPTHSLHWIADPGFSDAVARYLDAERDAIEQDIEILTEYGPFKKVTAEEQR